MKGERTWQSSTPKSATTWQGATSRFLDNAKEPLEDAAHVRNAVARFNQVDGASAEEKDEAWKRIQAAAKKYGVELIEKSRHELSKG